MLDYFYGKYMYKDRSLIDNIQFSKVVFLKLSRVSDQLLGVEKSFNKKVVEQDGRRSLLKV